MALRYSSQAAVTATRRVAAAVGWEVPIKGARVVQLPTREDNYVFLIQAKSGQTAVVDPSDAKPVIEAFGKLGWSPPSFVLNTHHHHDHTGGNLEVKEFGGHNCCLIGPTDEADLIPGLDMAVDEGDCVDICETELSVYSTPGHTRGHISFYAPSWSALFCGDTLFALGCGRLFEGTPEQMYESLNKFQSLPDETMVMCAHEYTQANADFCLTIEPNNQKLVQRVSVITDILAHNEPTVPSTLGEERETNCFLRSNEEEVKIGLGLTPDTPGVDVFAQLRQMKNNF